MFLPNLKHNQTYPKNEAFGQYFKYNDGRTGRIAFVEDISKPIETKVKQNQSQKNISLLHYFSVFSGPILSCIVPGIFCYFPIPNILKNPDYWYEFQLLLLAGSVHLFHAQILLQGSYWANFTYVKKWKSYFCLNAIGVLVFCSAQSFYYFIWVHVLDFTPPMPYNMYVAGTASFGSVFLAVWLRLNMTYLKTVFYLKITKNLLLDYQRLPNQT